MGMNKKLRILHIHVRKEYWLQAQQGIKEEEYREIKPYWTSRLNKSYDLIYYYLGYTKKKRIFRFDGYKTKLVIHKEWKYKPKEMYAISLKRHL